MEAEEREAKETKMWLKGLENGEYQPSEKLGPDVEEELEMSLVEDSVVGPSPILSSGLEDWDLTLR